MPVTARLSRRFYEAFGDEIANELVEWFNAVDATYRADLRELNELNFARFDAKVEQRFAAFDLKVEQRFAAFELKVEQRFAAFELKVDRRFAEAERQVDQRFAVLEEKFERRFAALETGLERVRADLIKWSFVFWLGMVVTIFVARLV